MSDERGKEEVEMKREGEKGEGVTMEMETNEETRHVFFPHWFVICFPDGRKNEKKIK